MNPSTVKTYLPWVVAVALFIAKGVSVALFFDTRTALGFLKVGKLPALADINASKLDLPI